MTNNEIYAQSGHHPTSNPREPPEAGNLVNRRHAHIIDIMLTTYTGIYKYRLIHRAVVKLAYLSTGNSQVIHSYSKNRANFLIKHAKLPVLI